MHFSECDSKEIISIFSFDKENISGRWFQIGCNLIPRIYLSDMFA